MKIFIRADGSEVIGIGHITRCLTLAKELHKRNCSIIFVVREIPKHIKMNMNSLGFLVVQCNSTYRVGSIEDAKQTLELLRNNYSISDKDWLIVDHYSIDYEYELFLKNLFSNIMVIDDLANRYHECNLLLDVNLQYGADKYRNLVPHSATVLLGPNYSLLRQEFKDVRRNIENTANHNKHSFSNILICFGGTDPSNETLKAIRALEPLLNDLSSVKVILGKANPNIKEIFSRYREESKLDLIVQPKSMASEMASTDLAVCAGGSMTWERYCLGLPGAVITIADNQLEVAKNGEKQGIDKFIGSSQVVCKDDITRTVEELLMSVDFLQEARRNAMELVDGKGAIRVANYLMQKEESHGITACRKR